MKTIKNLLTAPLGKGCTKLDREADHRSAAGLEKKIASMKGKRKIREGHRTDVSEVIRLITTLVGTDSMGEAGRDEMMKSVYDKKKAAFEEIKTRCLKACQTILQSELFLPLSLLFFANYLTYQVWRNFLNKTNHN